MPLPLHFSRERLLGAWTALERLHREGKVRAIGLSNVEAQHVAWLVRSARIAPHVVQNVASVFYPGHELADQPPLFEVARKHGIVLQGYSPLGASDNSWLPSACDAHVVEIARQVGRSPGEVALHWWLRAGGAAATQSLHELHRRQALRAHTVPLTAGHLAYLDSLAALYHRQPDTQGPPVTELSGYTCSGVGSARHVLLRPLCQSPPYRVQPPEGVYVPAAAAENKNNYLHW